MLDASGFVRRSQVFAGNVREHRTLAEMLDVLDAPREALVVMDRGIATEECVKWLRENDYSRSGAGARGVVWVVAVIIDLLRKRTARPRDIRGRTVSGIDASDGMQGGQSVVSRPD